MVLWAIVLSSRLRILVENRRPFFILCTRRIWDLIPCLVWLDVWLRTVSGQWYGLSVGGLEFPSSEWYGTSTVLIALSEETERWSPIRWEDFGWERKVEEFSIPEEGLSDGEVSERKEGRFSGADDLDCAWWDNNAEIDFAIHLVQKGIDSWISLDLKS